MDTSIILKNHLLDIKCIVTVDTVIKADMGGGQKQNTNKCFFEHSCNIIHEGVYCLL